MIFDENGKQIQTVNPIAMKAFVKDEIMKSDLRWAFNESEMTVKKKGSEIKAALVPKLAKYEAEKQAALMSLVEIKSEVVTAGLPEPLMPNYDSHDDSCSPIKSEEETDWNELNSVQKRARSKWSNVCYQLQQACDDIKTAKVLMNFLEDGKTYPLNLRQAMMLF